MNTGVRHQNQANYLYPEEQQDYDDHDQHYDEQYMDEGQYDQYQDHRYHQQNPSSQRHDQYEGYSRSKSPNAGRGMRQDDDDGYRGTQRSTAKDAMNQQGRHTAQSRGGYNDNAHHGYEQGYDENYEEPQSITEVIDANRVKTSKLFQKFLQKENKVNPNKPNPPKNVKAGSTSPINRKNAKETVKPKNSTPKAPQYQDHVQNQGQYSPHNQGFAHEAQQFKDRAIPNYNEQEEIYGQPHRESPHQGDFQQGFNPNFHRAPSNEYDYPQDPRSNPDLDLNQQSSSKLVSLQNTEQYPPQNFPCFQGPPPNGPFMMPPGGFPYGYGMNPEMMKAQQQQYQNQNSPMGNPGEVLMLRAQLAEMSQAMQREIEANKTLDMKCTEYLGQLEKSAQNFEEFKQRLFDQGSGHQEEIRRLEDKIRHLNDALNEKDRAEEQQTAEITRLKKKLDAELESRGRLLEEHDDLERRKFEELDNLKRELEQKDEELSRLRREHDSSRHDKDSFKSSEERFLREIRGLKADNTELNRINEDLRKAVDDKTQQLNLANMEINSVRNQLDTMDGQYRDLLSENDRTKRDTFGLKERLLAAESEIKTLQMTLEKTQINIDQAAEALSRTEGALERERRVNADLRAQIAAETRNNNQWDTPQSQPPKDYSSNRRGEGSRTFDEPTQQQQPPYSRQEPVIQSRPQTNQFQPTKYEMKRDNVNRPYTAEEPQQQRGQRYQEPAQIEQPNRRQQQQNYNQPDPYYQENNNRFGGRDNTTNQPNRNQRGWGNNEPPQEPYQQQQPRYDERPIKGGIGQQRNQPQHEDPFNSRSAPVNPGMKRSVHEQYGTGPNQPKLSSQNQVYKPTGNLLAWDEPPVDNKPVNRRGKEIERPPVEENANMNMGGRRPQQQNYQPPEERTTPVNNMNQKQNQPPVFGKEDQKPPQDLSQVKGFETELMNLQMQKDNINNELQRLDKAKIKSGANIKRKQELESELSFVQSSISNVKTKLRELNVLLPF